MDNNVDVCDDGRKMFYLGLKTVEPSGYEQKKRRVGDPIPAPTRIVTLALVDTAIDGTCVIAHFHRVCVRVSWFSFHFRGGNGRVGSSCYGSVNFHTPEYFNTFIDKLNTVIDFWVERSKSISHLAAFNRAAEQPDGSIVQHTPERTLQIENEKREVSHYR